MKKILLGGLLALGAGFGLQAQTIDVYVDGVKASEGDTLTVSRATTEDGMLKAYTIFKNVSQEALTLTGKKTASLPEDTEDGWCIWGECKTLNDIVADFPLEPGKMYMGGTEYFDFTPFGYEGKDVYVTYTFSTKEHPDQTLTFTLQWVLGKGPEKPITVTVDGQEVSNGQFLTLERKTEEEKMLHVDMTFENPGTETVTVKGAKKAFLADGTEDAWCMFGSCWMQDVFTGQWAMEPGKIEESSKENPIYLEYSPFGYVGNESVIYYTFSTVEDEFNSVYFAVRWITTGGVANENAADLLKTAVYPNPAVETARLSWEAVEGAVVLNVRSVSGQLLYSRSVEGMTEAEINVANFTPGMYFYTLERQGERLGSGKLLVR